jgi:hypothetical protein
VYGRRRSIGLRILLLCSGLVVVLALGCIRAASDPIVGGWTLAKVPAPPARSASESASASASAAATEAVAVFRSDGTFHLVERAPGKPARSWSGRWSKASARGRYRAVRDDERLGVALQLSGDRLTQVSTGEVWTRSTAP